MHFQAWKKLIFTNIAMSKIKTIFELFIKQIIEFKIVLFSSVQTLLNGKHKQKTQVNPFPSGINEEQYGFQFWN